MDQKVRSPFLLKFRWISKRQRICFAVAFVLDEDFIGGSPRFDVDALGRSLSLRKSECVQIKNGLCYLDCGGNIHDWRVQERPQFVATSVSF